MSNRTIGPKTYVKKNKYSKLEGNWHSGKSQREIKRKPRLVNERSSVAMLGLKPEQGKKKFRKGGNNRSNALGGRKGAKYTGGKK